MERPLALADVWEELSLAERDQILTFVKNTNHYRHATMASLALTSLDRLFNLISLDRLFNLISGMDLHGIEYWANNCPSPSPLEGALVLDKIWRKLHAENQRERRRRRVFDGPRKNDRIDPSQEG